MKRRLISLLLIAALLAPACALGAGNRQYIVPDSNTRYLTAEELWEWDYESIGFIFNEIFARHGYNFIVGGPYYNYFQTRPWYAPNANPNNTDACYPRLNDIEWDNERLCKDVRAQMRALGTTNPNGKHYLDYIERGVFDVLSGFVYTQVKAGQKWPVYSAPGTSSWRGANGKAVVSTNGSVYVAGWDGGWLLLMYETNNGAVRVGYASAQSMKDRVTAPMLTFAYTTAACTRAVSLTDDPATSFTAVRTLAAGEKVTYLTSFQNRYTWAYVETTVDGKTVRGFIPANALDLGMGMDENEDVNYK